MNADSPLRWSLSLTIASISFAAFLVSAQPANDMFANRTPISGTNIVVTGSDVGASWEPGEPVVAGVGGGATIWWTWSAPIAGEATISTAGSTFDTVLGAYSGQSVSQLTEIASDDDDTDSGVLTSKVVFDVTAGQTYQIAVDGYGGDSGAVRLSVQLGPHVPPPPAPGWQLPDLNGLAVRSTDFAGKVVLLNFWATWCGPCKAEMPDLVALQDNYRADGLVIIGADVSWSGESAQTVQNFLWTWSPTVNYQVVMSNSGNESRYGGIDAIPTTFIIDRNNFIRKKFVGSQSRPSFERAILPLLYCNTSIQCEQSGNQMIFRWPVTAVAFTLESSTNPAGPSWSAWPTMPIVVNGTNTIQVPMTESARYFRLRMPY